MDKVYDAAGPYIGMFRQSAGAGGFAGSLSTSYGLLDSDFGRPSGTTYGHDFGRGEISLIKTYNPSRVNKTIFSLQESVIPPAGQGRTQTMTTAFWKAAVDNTVVTLSKPTTNPSTGASETLQDYCMSFTQTLINNGYTWAGIRIGRENAAGLSNDAPVFDNPKWSANSTISNGSVREPSSYTGWKYTASVSSSTNSGSTEPNWITTGEGNSFTDAAGITWTAARTDAYNFVTFFRRVIPLMKDLAAQNGLTLYIIWNGCGGPATTNNNISQSFPGWDKINGYTIVDAMGPDVYANNAEGMFPVPGFPRWVYSEIDTRPWSTGQTVVKDAVREPSSSNGHLYIASAAGTTGTSTPAWPTSVGGTVTDNGITWKEYCGPWTSSTSIPPGTYRNPSSAKANGHYYKAIGNSTASTGTSEPVWPTTSGAQVNDGGVVWQEAPLPVYAPGETIIIRQSFMISPASGDSMAIGAGTANEEFVNCTVTPGSPTTTITVQPLTKYHNYGDPMIKRYPVGAKVSHYGQTYYSLVANNSAIPSPNPQTSTSSWLYYPYELQNGSIGNPGYDNMNDVERQAHQDAWKKCFNSAFHGQKLNGTQAYCFVDRWYDFARKNVYSGYELDPRVSKSAIRNLDFWFPEIGLMGYPSWNAQSMSGGDAFGWVQLWVAWMASKKVADGLGVAGWGWWDHDNGPEGDHTSVYSIFESREKVYSGAPKPYFFLTGRVLAGLMNPNAQSRVRKGRFGKPLTKVVYVAPAVKAGGFGSSPFGDTGFTD